MSDYHLCDCGRGYFDPTDYRTCYECFTERRIGYTECIWCGRWHSIKFDTCYQCRVIPGRDEAARDLRLDIFMRDEFTCQNCGVTEGAMHVDHVEPCAKGGLAVPWNLQVLCAGCNGDKGTQYDWRWEERRLRLMHLYLSFGWGLLDDQQRDRLIREAQEYGDMFTFHAHYRENAGAVLPLPQWALAMADAWMALHRCRVWTSAGHRRGRTPVAYQLFQPFSYRRQHLWPPTVSTASREQVSCADVDQKVSGTAGTMSTEE